MKNLSRKEMKTVLGGKAYGGDFLTPSCGEECDEDGFCSENTSCPCFTGGVC